MKTIRQGDVALVLIDVLPENCTEVLPENGRIVLAHGEVTGHAHAVYGVNDKVPAVRLWNAEGERFLQVLVKSALQHEEHSTAYLDIGIYRLPTQVEYTPSELRVVAD